MVNKQKTFSEKKERNSCNLSLQRKPFMIDFKEKKSKTKTSIFYEHI